METNQQFKTALLIATLLCIIAGVLSDAKADERKSQPQSLDFNSRIENRVTNEIDINNKLSSTSQAVAAGGSAQSHSVSGSYSTGGQAYTGASQSSATQASSNNGVTFSSPKYPNQAPAVFTTSSASYSQRNCTPVGSVNASGPFGGLGLAFPMGGDICNAQNVADFLERWASETNDVKLWEVSCQGLVEASDDLESAFEKVGYSCHEAAVKRQADITAKAKMAALQR